MSHPTELPADESTGEGPDRSSEAALVARLYEQIRGLEATARELRRLGEAIEADLRELSAENYRLRREMTLSALIEDLVSSEASSVGPEEWTGRRLPRTAADLYRRLPTRFRFSVFFRLAEERGLGAEQARRVLLWGLRTGRFVQVGAYLEKAEPAV